MEKILGESSDLKNYILRKGVSESVPARSLRLLTQEHELSRMLSSAEQVQLLCLLLKLTQAKKVAEVGVFTGYSTLRMAEALSESGHIFACDISDQWMQTGVPFWEEAGVDHKITPVIAPAEDTLSEFLDQGQADTFDLIYIDADKVNYLTYYQLAKQLVRPGGLVVVDNTLWGGQVVDSEDDTDDTVAIRKLNTFISKDVDVERVLLPVGDGLTIAMRPVLLAER